MNAPNEAKRKLLVVDDEPSMTRMLKRNLEATGLYEVRTENESEAALAAAHEFGPDLVLLDVMMPGLDGGEVAAQFKNDAALRELPVIFLTAAITREEAQRSSGQSAGRTFLAKPVKFDELLACLEKHLIR